jgi:hypothetical protein
MTGRFPVRPSEVSWYVMLIYSFDCKSILVAPMKSLCSTELLKAYGGIHQTLTARGFTPKLQTMDNEASSALKSYLTENAVIYHVVPDLRQNRNILPYFEVDNVNIMSMK